MINRKKVLLITGSGKRIGREIVLRLPVEKYKFIIHYNESKKDADDVIKKIRGEG